MTRPGYPWSVARRIVLSCLIVVAASCSGGPTPGTAVTVPNSNGQIFKIRMGQQFSYDEIYLRNQSGGPITLKSVELLPEADLDGRIETLKMVIAPLHSNRDTTPGGIWSSFPPTVRVFRSGPCVVQHIEPLDGYVLPPGGEARVIMLMKVARQGPFRAFGDLVTYEEGGNTRVQVLPNEFRGKVTTGPGGVEVTDIEQVCAALGNILPQAK